jgi:GT2 family glycosyltransferase
MRLSVVVICLNEEKNLPRCLRALRELAPAGLSVEILVVDGGSADRSKEVAGAFAAQVVDSRRGIPVQRNVGGHAAQGELLAFVDADVEILPGWFECVAQQFAAAGPRPLKLVGAAPQLPPDASWVARTFALHWGAPAAAQAGAAGDPRHLSTQSLVMDRAVFALTQGFSEALAVDEDTVFVLTAREHGVSVLCDQHLAYIHHGEPRTLGDFFRRTRWGANYAAWLAALWRGDRTLAWRPQYLYGAAAAVALGGLGLSVLLPVGGWQLGLPLSLTACGALVVLPALRTAHRQKAYDRLAPLCAMYGTYALALGTALWGLPWNKARRWR